MTRPASGGREAGERRKRGFYWIPIPLRLAFTVFVLTIAIGLPMTIWDTQPLFGPPNVGEMIVQIGGLWTFAATALYAAWIHPDA